MTEFGVFIGNDPTDLAAFEGWLGGAVEGVAAFTGPRDWDDAAPGWQLSPSSLGGAGRNHHWTIPLFPGADDALTTNVATMQAAAKNEKVLFGGELLPVKEVYGKWAKQILDLGKDRPDDTSPIYVRTAWELGGVNYWTPAAASDKDAFKLAFANFA